MQDPVEARSGDDEDLYDVTEWEERTALDRLAVRTYRGVLSAGRRALVGLGVAILVLVIVGSGAGALIVDDPYFLGLVVLSAVPAGLLALYIYTADITTSEPPMLVAGTFVLAVLFAGFAAIINGLFGFLQVIPVVGLVLFFYLVVGPVEEAVKLLAVRLYAYRDERFDSVVDGAVYGAVAGLGFATIENVLYITDVLYTTDPATTRAVVFGQIDGGVLDGFLGTLGAGGKIAATRSLAGPGHVIYSAFAGYYLGLAKFNRENAGPIVAKGLLIAAFIHATYNTLAGPVVGLASILVPGVPVFLLFFAFVVAYQGLFFYVLYRKLQRYRHHYLRVHDGDETAPEHDAELTEFEPGRDD